MCKAKKPDTSAQQAEAARQAQVEQQRYQEQLAAQQTEWDRQRTDAEARYQQQLQTMQAEIARQGKQQQDQQSAAEALAKKQQQDAEASAARGRSYADYRDQQVQTGKAALDQAYAGFDSNYFNNFATDFVAANRGDSDRSWERNSRDMKYKLADNHNLNSSAAADGFGELDADHNSAIAKITSAGQQQANDLRNQIAQQKSNSLNSLLALGNQSVPGFQTDADAAAAQARFGSAISDMTRNLVAPAHV